MKPTTIIATAWSLVTGLAGGWLILSPWAFGEQPSGHGWTSVTQTAFFTGLGLVVLALAGVAVAVANAVMVLRAAGVINPAQPGRRPAGRQTTESPEFESALIALAQALAADLSSRQQESGQHPHSSQWPSGPRPPSDSRPLDFPVAPRSPE